MLIVRRERMKYIVSILLVTCLAGCCSTHSNSIRGAVLPTSKGHWIPDSIDGKTAGGWTPSQRDIGTAQPIILKYIKDSNAALSGRLHGYRCQYFGIIVNGKKRIHCNFFRMTEDAKDWKTNPVVVDGGGDWYFQVEYDVENHSCMHFSVNHAF